MKNIHLFLVFVFFLNPLYSQVINYDNDIVEKNHFSYIEKGRIPPFFYGPVFSRQINRASEKIGAQYYISSENKDGAIFSAETALAMHFFSKEESIENIEKGSANNAIDYTKNYLSQPPFLSVGFEFLSRFGLGGGLKSEIYRPFTNDYFELFNISFTSVDKNFMQEGYLFIDNAYASLLVGRINSQMGIPYSDALLFNNNIPYTDSIRLFIPFGSFFNVHWQITNIPAVESLYQKDIATGNSVEKNKADYYYGFEEDDFPSIILNTYQRFGFQNSIIRAGLALNVFLVRRNNRFEFVDFFPFSDWHASDVITNNMSLGVDFSIVPTKNLLLGIQLGFDEINGNSIGLGDTDTPTIWSLIGTMQNTFNTDFVRAFFSTNIGYTHYLWGNFSGYSVGDSAEAALAKGLYRYHMQNPMYMPYSSEYGPGAIWASLETDITFYKSNVLKNMHVTPVLLFLYKEKNTNLIETVYEKRTKKIPSDIYFSIEIPTSYSWKGFEASISPSFHVKGLHVPTITWFELKISVKANLLLEVFQENSVLSKRFRF